jgi:hypothetical protein
MTGLLRKAAMTACGLAVAATAFAGVPSPGNSTIPGRINLVGTDVGGVPDAAASGATVTVTVRDLANNPIANSTVVLDFANCTVDTRFGDVQPFAGLTTNCGAKTVRAFTDVAGQATFVVVGGGFGTPAAHAVGCGRVFADGVQLGTLNVGFYDMNGVAGVGGADLALWASDFGGGGTDRTDYDNSGATGGADLAIWATVFGVGGSNTSAATYCP